LQDSVWGVPRGRDRGRREKKHVIEAAARRLKVLVVEDEEPIRDLVCFHLGLAGYECQTVGDGREALRHVFDEPFDLIVLDVVLPGLDGVSLCRAVRRDGPNRDVPILMLTARREESDKVLGLESGADDYLTKPFGMREFVARTGALLRRLRTPTAPAPPAPSALTSLGVTIDLARRRVTCDGRSVSLTPQEFNLLYVLASEPGVVFSREALLERVWEDEVFVTDRGVDTLVKRLRRKIERDPAKPTRIITVWGSGYKFGDV
jgi:DNA-binding response OmpR family regulator